MRNDVVLHKWMIQSTSEYVQDDFLESVFFTGNGRMGARGYLALDPNAKPEKTGLFAAGIFGELKSGITDFVNLPSPIYTNIEIDGCLFLVQNTSVQRSLNLQNGLFTAEYIVCSKDELIKIQEERFFSLANTELLVQRIVVKASKPHKIRFLSGVHTVCCNLPIPDDQMKENKETVKLVSLQQTSITDNNLQMKWSTQGTNIDICQEISFRMLNLQSRGSFQDENGVGIEFVGAELENTDYVLEQCTTFTTSRDINQNSQKANGEWSFSSLLAESDIAWSERWKNANIEIEGDERADAALRYAIFQLIANDSARDSTVSIGARGLTHTRYKGCYFWDTDLFMMPFYLYTYPKAARNLMLYRIHTLPQAKKHALKMNNAGARYPWMVSYDGTEQCESWDIGASELHITADVVFALNQYIQVTGDNSFYENNAVEAYVETARFWVSRYTPEPGTDKVNLLFCKGPDEYCGVTTNNLYTNMLVQLNLALAVKAASFLQQHDKEMYHRLGITEDEINKWMSLKNKIPLPKDPVTGHWRQDDTLHLLEPVPLSLLKSGDAASYRKVCFDRLQRYRVIKQADVLLLMSRMPEAFTEEEKQAAWADFEPICLHDSTLSFATHSLFAAQNGIIQAAEEYFKKALYLDLCDVMENTGDEGLHLACLGETWQAVVFGFGGLTFKNGKPILNPHLPPAWKKLQYQFYYQGELYQADIEQQDASIQKISCD